MKYVDEIYTEILEKLSQIKDSREKLVSTLNYLNNNVLKGDTEDADMSIPFEYESVVEQITESVFNGFVIFLNPETLETEQVDGEAVYEPVGLEYGEQNEDRIDDFGLTYTEWDNFIRFEPFSNEDMLDRIDLFINNLDDEKLKNQLEDFDDKEELLRQFPSILERTGYTEDWDMFRRNEIESYVKSQLIETIRRHTDAEEEIYTIGE